MNNLCSASSWDHRLKKIMDKDSLQNINPFLEILLKIYIETLPESTHKFEYGFKNGGKLGK